MLSFLSRLGLALVAAALATNAVAQAFPHKPVTIVVPFPAGGSMDALARMTGQKLSEAWGQPVVVENRAGAGGMVGALRVKSLAPDGHALLLTNSALIQNVVGPLAATAPYAPVKDFAPVLHMVHAPVVYVASARLAPTNLQDFVALVQREKGRHAFGSGGVNQTLHLLGATFNQAAGLDMVHVPHKGEAPLVSDLIGGHVSSSFTTIAAAGPHIASGAVRALAVAGPRSPLLPEVPSFRDLGYAQLDVVGWFGMFAPAGTPPPVVDRIATDITAVLQMPDVQARLREMALTPTALGPAEFGRIVQRDLGYWDGVVRAVGER